MLLPTDLSLPTQAFPSLCLQMWSHYSLDQWLKEPTLELC